MADASVPEPESPTGVAPPPQQPAKVVVMFKATGDAPILKQNKFKARVACLRAGGHAARARMRRGTLVTHEVSCAHSRRVLLLAHAAGASADLLH
jgi:hypothetical protein